MIYPKPYSIYLRRTIYFQLARICFKRIYGYYRVELLGVGIEKRIASSFVLSGHGGSAETHGE